MKRKSVKRVLPADVYDALELSALAFGGIGGGRYYKQGTPVSPYCAVGHASFLDTDCSREAWSAWKTGGITERVNDEAVRAINTRLGKPAHSRVTFKEWCKELNVTRAASEVVPK